MRNRRGVTDIPVLVLLFLFALSGLRGATSGTSPELRRALASIGTNDLVLHTAVLSSDKFEGRAPGTHGEELTVEYLVSEYKRLGLQPGNPQGGYIQKVPLTGFTSTPRVSFLADGKPLDLTVPTDLVAWSRRLSPTV